MPIAIPRWARRALALLAAGLVALQVPRAPRLLLERGAAELLAADPAAERSAALGAVAWGPVGDGDFATGGELYEREWVFGTPMMRAACLAQVSLRDRVRRGPSGGGDLAAELAGPLDDAVRDMTAPAARAFSESRWGSDPLQGAAADHDHAAWLGYAGFALGLASRARREGASVHGLIGAAELIAARGLFGDAAGDAPTLMLTSPVDLRGTLASPMDDSTPGFYVTLLSSLARVDGPASLAPLARHLTADLRRQVAQGCGHLFYHLAAPAETIPATAEGIAGFRAWMKRMPPAFLLSNVGRAGAMAEAGGVRVEEISFALCPMAHQPLFVAASTWDGRLALNVVHDRGRLPAEAARGVAARMEALLREAAG